MRFLASGVALLASVVLVPAALAASTATTGPRNASAATSTTTTTTATAPPQSGSTGPPIISGSSGNGQSTGGSVNYGPAPSLPAGMSADPACHEAGLGADARRACTGSGSPLAPFPSQNYDLDVHVDSGLLSPSDTVAGFFQGLAGWIWGVLVGLLGTVFSWLAAAFSFDLFSSDHAGRVPAALHGISSAFTSPLLPAVLAIGGGWALWHWLKHSEGRALGHLLAMVASMVALLVLIADPVGILGGVDRDVNAVSGNVLSVFATGRDGGSGSFASAETGLWHQAVERPWCALEFGQNTSWCMAPATAAYRSDALAHVKNADQNSTAAIQADESRRLALARTNGELWLSFPANDDARNGKNDSWTLYHHLLADHPELAAIRGSGGVGSRWVALAIVLVGVVPFLLLLLYVAVHLLAAAVMFVLLLLLAPIAVLLPAFGEGGRAATARWAGGLLVATLMKLGYAAALGALILTSGLLTDLLGGAWTLAWGLWALLWVMAWMHRGKLLSAFTLGMHREAHSMMYRRSMRRHGSRAIGAARGAVGMLGSIPMDQERWRRPGETRKRPARVAQPVRVDSWQEKPAQSTMPSRQPPPVIEGREVPALPTGERS